MKKQTNTDQQEPKDRKKEILEWLQIIIAAAVTITTAGIITVTTIIAIIATQELACRKQRTVTTQVIRRAGKNLKLRVLREDQKKIGKK